MIVHAIQSLVLYTLLYGCYALFLKKETFFQFNRFYLVAIPFIALAMPFLKLPIKTQIDSMLGFTKETAAVIPVIEPTAAAFTMNPSDLEHVTEETLSTIPVIVLIYGLGFFIAYLIFCYKLAVIQEFIESAKTQFIKPYRIMRSEKVQGGFSFLDMIFINPKESLALNEHIINHELIHVKQRHSWDLIAHECVRVVFWFNPLLIKAHRDLQATHEFIVDRKLAKQDVYGYKSKLLQSILQCPEHALTNAFYKSSILKNRIIMLQKTASPVHKILKLVAIIPVLALIIGYNAVAQTPQINDNNKLQEVTPAAALHLTQTDYPALSTFKYGQVDWNNGLTQQEIALYENRRIFKEENDEDFYKYLMTEESAVISKISRIRSANAITVVRDDANNNQLSELHENTESPSFTSLGNYFKLGMTNEEYRGILRKVAREKPLSDYMYSIETINLLKNRYAEKEIQSKTYKTYEKKVVETSNQLKQVTETVTFATVAKPPHFENCEGTHDELKKCVSNRITEFVNNNFNTKVISHENNKGRHIIMVQFKIDTNGKAVDVTSKSKSIALQQEAERVLSLLPQMIPAQDDNGENVNVIYGLPIIFKID